MTGSGVPDAGAQEQPPWLSVVGIGEDGPEALSPAARRLIAAADVVLGGRRHLDLLAEDGRERLAWPAGLTAALPGLIADLIRRRSGRAGFRACVLASGDPLDYGIATAILRLVPVAECVVVPAPGAFALACARLGWAREEVETVSLHGRPPALIQPLIQPGARILALSADGGTPAAVAALLRARGYGRSRLIALQHLGGPAEARAEATATDWGDRPVAALNTLAVTCVADPGMRPLPLVPGLPDDVFRHDGQLTKREIRAATLAALAPVPGAVLWDVGAGCGSVAIEWMRCHPRCRAIAIERDPARLALIAANAEALGCPGLVRVAGVAPLALDGLPAPDAVFIGGGLTVAGLAARCWAALAPGGRLVANAVTVGGEQVLAGLQARFGGDLTRLAVARAEPLGPHAGWRPLMPVTQWHIIREAGS